MNDNYADPLSDPKAPRLVGWSFEQMQSAIERRMRSDAPPLWRAHSWLLAGLVDAMVATPEGQATVAQCVEAFEGLLEMTAPVVDVDTEEN